MLRKTWTSLMAGAAFALAGAGAASAKDELTIFWAEWDPANYLQELVNSYPDATITVQTTPWPDFQTKAFAEFNAKGDAYDMVVGDSQWLGAGSTQGHYVDLTDFFAKHNVGKLMAPATVTYYAEYPKGAGKYWAIPLEGDAAGWAYRKDWFEDPKEKEAFKAKYGYFANPAGPDGKSRFAALGGQGVSIVSYSKKQEASMKFLEWFVKDETQKKWAELGGYTCSAAVLESEAFRKATPFNEAFYQTMFMVKDFWANPEYAELLTAINNRVYPYVVGGKGTAKEALDATVGDWDATFKKYGYVK